MDRYQNPELTPEERADDLLSQLSLDEKMAQVTGMLCMPVFRDEDTAKLRAMYPHGAGQVSGLPLSFLHGIEQVRICQRVLQTMVMEQSEHHIPAIFHNEGLCGAVLPGAETFPSGIGRGATFDPELEEKIGAITGRQELTAGITQILSPVIDIARDPRHGRQGEAYSEDPTLSALMGAAQVRGQQSVEVGGLRAVSCAKHFMGYHLSAGGINTAHTEIGPRELREVHGKPFQAAINEAGLRTVMPCYNAMDDGPVSSSSEMLTQILRNEMGLPGTAISDYGAVRNIFVKHHVSESTAEAGYASMSAGMDTELPTPVCFNAELKEMFEDGRADIAVLDRAVRRVLIEKFRMGLFEHPFGPENDEAGSFYTNPSDDAVSLQAARESLVLLKNTGVLPMQKGIRRIAVIGPHANWANHYFGGYTRLSGLETAAAAQTSQAGMADNDKSNAAGARLIAGTDVQFSETEVFRKILEDSQPGCRTLADQLRADLPDTEIRYSHGYQVIGSGSEEYEEALEICRDADLIILTLGGKFASGTIATSGEGVDTADINLPFCQDNFIKAAAELGRPMVGIHFDSRPISSDTADRYLDAIIEAWNPGPFAAQVLSEVLRGAYNPSGRMPVTTARTAGQIPIYYNHPNGSCWDVGENVGFDHYVTLSHEPRYHFGYGLSYTTFKYSNLTLPETAAAGDRIKISCSVTNTGKVFGTEVVQLYVRDEKASMLRPIQELAGFIRLALEPGQTKQIEFFLNPTQLAFLTRDMRWKVEHGAYTVKIGGSSIYQPLTGSFTLTEDRYIEGWTRAFHADARTLAEV